MSESQALSDVDKTSHHKYKLTCRGTLYE